GGAGGAVRGGAAGAGGAAGLPALAAPGAGLPGGAPLISGAGPPAGTLPPAVSAGLSPGVTPPLAAPSRAAAPGAEAITSGAPTGIEAGGARRDATAEKPRPPAPVQEPRAARHGLHGNALTTRPDH